MSNVTALSYLVSAVCFILTLRGMSSPESSRRGNILGMIGMVIAIGTTLGLPQVGAYGRVIAAIAFGGIIGTIIARRITMTAMPQLVAAFHSLVGMAAVL